MGYISNIKEFILKKVTLNAYARMKKKSMFAVVKEIQNGKLESIEEEIDGIKKRFVLIPDKLEESDSKHKHQNSNLSLEDEIKLLKDEINALKDIINRCCKEFKENR